MTNSTMYSHVLSLFLSFKGLSTGNLLSNVSDGRPRPLLWETNKKFTGTFSNPLSLLAAPLFSLHDIAPLLLILISVHPLRALPFLPSRCTRPSFFCSWCVFQRLGEQLAGVPRELWGYQIKWIIDPAYDSNVLFFHHFFSRSLSLERKPCDYLPSTDYLTPISWFVMEAFSIIDIAVIC